MIKTGKPVVLFLAGFISPGIDIKGSYIVHSTDIGETFFLGFSWLLRVASNPWHSPRAAASRPVSSRGCLPSVSVSGSKVSSSYENSSCIRFRVPSNPVGPNFFS